MDYSLLIDKMWLLDSFLKLLQVWMFYHPKRVLEKLSKTIINFELYI